MQLTPVVLWPECNSFHGPELECHSTQPCMQAKTNYHIITTGTSSWQFNISVLSQIIP